MEGLTVADTNYEAPTRKHLKIDFISWQRLDYFIQIRSYLPDISDTFASAKEKVACMPL